MARRERKDFFGRVSGQGVIPVFSSPIIEVNEHVIEACFRAGVEIFEFTNRVPRAAHLFETLRNYCEKEFPDLILGAGTIRRQSDAKDFISAGAQFIVGPNYNSDIVLLCSGVIPYCPGCMTPSEIETAQEALGEEAIIKVFPGSVLGPGFVQAVRATNSSLRLMVTGGIERSRQSLKTWFDAGAAALGTGLNANLVNEKLWGKLSEEMRQLLEFATELKSR